MQKRCQYAWVHSLPATGTGLKESISEKMILQLRLTKDVTYLDKYLDNKPSIDADIKYCHAGE